MSAHGRHVWYELMTMPRKPRRPSTATWWAGRRRRCRCRAGPIPCSWPARRPLAGLMEQPEEMRRMGSPQAGEASSPPKTWMQPPRRRDAPRRTSARPADRHSRRGPLRDRRRSAGGTAFKASSPGLEQTPEPGTPGHIGWHELYACRTGRRRSRSTRSCSAGRRPMRSTWATWAPTSSSAPAGRRSAACSTSRLPCRPGPALPRQCRLDRPGGGPRIGRGRPDPERSHAGARRHLDRAGDRSEGVMFAIVGLGGTG